MALGFGIEKDSGGGRRGQKATMVVGVRVSKRLGGSKLEIDAFSLGVMRDLLNNEVYRSIENNLVSSPKKFEKNSLHDTSVRRPSYL